jgi:hypothetical protein
MIVPLVSATSSYSRCEQVTDGGSLALRRCLCHTGRIYGERAPRAISPTAIMNWTKPAASLIVWLRRKVKMNPPHLRRVTCQSGNKRTSICFFKLTDTDRDYQMKCVLCNRAFFFVIFFKFNLPLYFLILIKYYLFTFLYFFYSLLL